MTFIEYLNNVRLFHAVDEILYTEKNITHIALDNGFPTSAAFTKAFRESYHEAPSEYRRKMQKIEQEEHDEKELNEKKQRPDHSYLRIREKGEIPEVSSEELCDVYADKSEKHTSCTYRACNIGDVYSILQSDVQEQIKLIKSERECNIYVYGIFCLKNIALMKMTDIISENWIRYWIFYWKMICGHIWS